MNTAKRAQQGLIDEVKSKTEQAISTIQSETATEYEKAQAYETLKTNLPGLTEQYSLAEIAAMDFTTAIKEQAEALEELRFEQKRQEIENYKKEVKRLEGQQKPVEQWVNTGKIDATGQPVLEYQAVVNDTELKATQQALAAAEQEYAQMVKDREEAKKKQATTTKKLTKEEIDLLEKG